MKKLWIALMIIGVGGCQVLEASDPGSEKKSTFRQRVSKAKDGIKKRLPKRPGQKKELSIGGAPTGSYVPPEERKEPSADATAITKAFETLKQDYPQVFDDRQLNGLNMPAFLAAVKPLREQGMNHHPLYVISLYMVQLDKIEAQQKIINELERMKREQAQKISRVLRPEQIAELPSYSKAQSMPQWKKMGHSKQTRANVHVGGHRQPTLNSAASKNALWQKAHPKE